MTEKQKKITRLVYGIILSALTIVAGVLLIVQSQRIYHSTPISPYSREVVAKYLSEISAVLYVWIAAVIVGAILWQIIPPEQKKLRGTIYNTSVLKRTKSRLPLGVSSQKLHRMEVAKAIVWAVAIAFAILSCVMIGLVVWNKNYYHLEASQFNPMQDMLNMLPKFMPWVAAALLVAIGVSVYTEISAKYELNEVKRLIVESKKNPEIIPQSVVQKKKLNVEIPQVFKSAKFKKYALLSTRVALAVVAVVFVIVGALNGGLLAVLEKAVNICRECIGLG